MACSATIYDLRLTGESSIPAAARRSRFNADTRRSCTRVAARQMKDTVWLTNCTKESLRYRLRFLEETTPVTAWPNSRVLEHPSTIKAYGLRYFIHPCFITISRVQRLSAHRMLSHRSAFYRGIVQTIARSPLCHPVFAIST